MVENQVIADRGAGLEGLPARGLHPGRDSARSGGWLGIVFLLGLLGFGVATVTPARASGSPPGLSGPATVAPLAFLGFVPFLSLRLRFARPGHL